MVVVLAPEAVDVQSDASALCEALQAVRNHLAAKVANFLALESQLNDTVGTVGQIDDGAAEGLVERGVGVAEAGEAGHGGKSLGKSAAEGYADIFGGVVVVNCVCERVQYSSIGSCVQCFVSWHLLVTHCAGRPCMRLLDSSQHVLRGHGACGPETQCLCSR